jgi:hypothetical protein
MKYPLSLFKPIILIAVVVIGLVGCASSPQLTPSVESSPTPEPSPTPNLNLKGDQQLSSVEFSEPQETGISGSLSGLVSVGSYTNSLGQKFTISVTGQQAQSITDYTKNTLFYLEALSSVVKGIKQEVVEDNTFASDLLAENEENLLIEVQLAMTPEEVTKNFSTGYDIYFDIDPPVITGITHDYRKKCQNSASATLWMEKGIGTVKGNLYKGATSTGERTISAPTVSIMLPTPASGFAIYDLAVRGAGAIGATNKYRVSGTWNLSYDDSPPTGGNCF